MRESKADWMPDTCPRCRGSRADPDQSNSVQRLSEDPASPGEPRFQLGVVPCRLCGGEGRIPRSGAIGRAVQ